MTAAGDWRVDIDDDQPDYVRMDFDEITDDGVLHHHLFMPPDVADQFADEIKARANWIRERHGD